jgi:hypothetical protein
LIDIEHYIGRQVMANTPVPLGDAPLAAAGRDRLDACANGSGLCQAFDTTGAAIGEFAVAVRRRPMRGNDWEAALEEQFQTEPARALRRLGDRLLKEIRPRTKLPLLDRVGVDADGNLWARTLDNYGTPVATWVVFSPEGRPLAAVATRRRFQLVEIGRDYLLGFSRDDDGVEYIELYPFRAPWPPGS